MEKKQAQDYIQQILNSRFDQEQFELFVRNLLNEFEPRDNNYSGNLIPEAFRDHISHYKRIGKYTDPEGEPMDILIIQTRSVNKLERARTALRNFVVRHLKNFDKYYAFVAFYSKEDNGKEWRLSLVKIDIEQERTDKGKIKAKEEIVPAKRFSYLVGEHERAYTAQKQLLPLLVNDHSNPLVVKEKDGDGSIEGAFSIEKVTDEFFEQYKDLFESLVKNERIKSSIEGLGLEPNRFVKKLLGQIVFLYFLQKKGWLGVPKDKKMGEGSKRFLQDRFTTIDEKGGNYFNDFLRFLFYEALAKEHNDEGIKYYFKRLVCKIPFLNGGLFEADYDWENADISIPNELFRNNEKNKAGDKGTGILDVFDRYNFTIKEDEPLEKEVAVDPEMLGKVFENMLEITERKSKGAFYTPREIVHYMCQESLIHYLGSTVNEYTESYQAIDADQTSLFGGSTNKKGNLKIELENKGDIRVPKEDIDQLIRQGHLVLEHETTVAGKGKETRSYQYKLPESIRKHAKQLDDALANIKICDPAIGSGAFPVGLLQEIVTARLVLNSFLQNKKHKPYYLKRHAIQESIYGVDIDASAIDIARLRLWLSMIVDEEDYDTIDALPNLDYKIVCGNSLIGLPAQGASRYPGLSDQLEALKEKFFNETNEANKKSLRNQINDQINKVLTAAEDFEGYKIDFDFKLFFSEVWHYKGGFDIVIANPPYVRQELIKDIKPILKKLYSVYNSTSDLYTYFYEASYHILRREGISTFITNNSWIRSRYGQKLREFFLSKTSLLNVINFEDEQKFHSAIVESNVLIFQRRLANAGHMLSFSKSIDHSFEKYKISQSLLDDDVLILEEPSTLEVKKKVEKSGIPLKHKGVKVNLGIKTGYNPAFYIDQDKYDEFVSYDKKTKKILKPLARGRNIKKYKISNSGTYLINTHNGLKKADIPRVMVEEDYPAIYRHLLQFEEQLGKRGDKGDHWTNLRNCAYLDLLEGEKVIWITLSDRANFAFDDGTYIINNSSYFLTGKKLKYLTAVLNSSVSEWYFNLIGPSTGMGTTRWEKTYVEQIPVPKTDSKTEARILLLVDYLMYLKEQSKRTIIESFFEQLTDAIISELYFSEEIKTAKKQILPHLGDLKPITDEMSDEDKLAIIQSEFERLYDPNHPVRNNLETLESVEEVRIIKEALK